MKVVAHSVPYPIRASFTAAPW